MVIKALEVKKLYGYINQKVSFNESISLLVGINGSGKTTILNLISWILRPNFSRLATIDFKEIVLNIELDNQKHEIKCSKSEEGTITVRVDTLKAYSLSVQDTHYREAHGARYWIERDSIASRNKKSNSLDFIHNLPKPMIIGLDRKIFVEEDEELFSERRIVRSGTQNVNSPIDRVSDLAKSNYSKYKKEYIDLSNSLRNVFMMSVFTEPDKKISDLNLREISAVKLRDLQAKVEDFLEKNNVEKDSLKIMKEYFKGREKIIKDYSKDPNDLDNKINLFSDLGRIKTIKHLLDAFMGFEDQVKEARSQIDIYLETLNSFFKDSKKEFKFNEEANSLIYINKINNLEYSLSNLSSGERQILILFTYLAFNSSSGQIFIIDEPEISLHPKWQHDFLPAVKKLMHKNTQLIIATHSPEIVGDNERYSKVLMPYSR